MIANGPSDLSEDLSEDEEIVLGWNGGTLRHPTGACSVYKHVLTKLLNRHSKNIGMAVNSTGRLFDSATYYENDDPQNEQEVIKTMNAAIVSAFTLRNALGEVSTKVDMQ